MQKSPERYSSGETTSATANGVTRSHLVVIHTRAGRLVKGYLRWLPASAPSCFLLPLPDLLQIQHETEGETSSVDLADVKAVFFVRTREGNVDYSEVKLFADESVSELWVRVKLADGESLEGRVENSICLLAATGFWLRPTDCVANNMIVYVPKGSVVDFHVIGIRSARQ